MGMKQIWLLVLLFFTYLPCQAHWYQRAAASIRHSLERGPRLYETRLAALSRNLDQKTFQAQAYHSSLPRITAARSILTIREKDWPLRLGYIQGTAFVLEEHYQGKKYLWGVTATHYLYQKPAANLPYYRKSVRVSFEAQSSAGMGDISLFPLPPQLAEQITPLQLSQQTPRIGDELFSVGFFDKDIQMEEHRLVQEITPSRMITSLQVDPEIKREGACGSPVLNQQQEVVGLHVGSSLQKQIGYVIPAEYIRRTLAAYHQSEMTTQSLLYKGIKLGEISINESIYSVKLYRENKLLHTISTYHKEKDIDYAHLESFLPDEDPDRIVFMIERNPFSMSDADQQYYTVSISYDLKTGEITRSEETGYDFPRR